MGAPIGLGNTTEWLLLKDSTRVASTTPDTPVQILNSEYSGLILIQALTANQGNICVGGSDTDITDGEEVFIAELEPGQTLTLPFRSANGLYLDVDNSGDGVMISRFG